MKVHPVVFSVSASVIVLFVLIGAIFDQPMKLVMDYVQNFIITYAGWYYIAVVAFFLIFVFWLLISPYGSVRLGKDNEDPDYSYLTWFSMLFSAGMGIGLLFFSVAEPMMHFANPPRGGEPHTIEAARTAMTITFFHWGLHAWAIYIVVALSLAFFGFRHGLPLSIRSALYPLIGEKIHGWMGNVVDILAVFGTLFGLATSLGLGVMQVNAGLDYLGLLSVSTTNQVILITVITIMATISVVTGLDVGIRRLSELNLLIALVLLLFVLFAGSTIFILSSFIQNLGNYVTQFIPMTFRTDAFIGLEWQKSWTMFYWAWWISWSPFVGMFIARVSRGRTIREFIGGVLFVPTIITFFWLTVFGNNALFIEMFGEGGMAAAVADNIPTAMFVMLNNMPLSSITATLATIVVVIFFVTSSDSGSLVIDIITSGGQLEPPVGQRIFWALTEGAVAAVLLITGGLLALQTAAITTALPFSLIMILICIGLVQGLRAEVSTKDPLSTLVQRLQRKPVQQYAPLPGSMPPETRALVHQTLTVGDWRNRLQELVYQSKEQGKTKTNVEKAWDTVEAFINETVLPAFNELKDELNQLERSVEIDSTEKYASIRVLYAGYEEFFYAIDAHVYQTASFVFPEITGKTREQNGNLQTKAKVVLRSGRKNEYNLNHWTKEGIIHDFIRNYSKWMGW